MAWRRIQPSTKPSRTSPPAVWWLARGTVLALITLVVGTSSSKAVEIPFGNLAPTTNTCAASAVGSNPGKVCANGLVFTQSGITFAATGYSNAFTTATALTLKPQTGGPLAPPSNAFGESGLGENASSTGGCSNIDCEIGGITSVAVVSTNPITDAIIGSVQSNESFQLYTGSTIATLAKFGGVVTGGTAGCNGVSGTDTCLITGFSALVVGVQSVSGNVLLSAVSQPRAPEPASLVMLGTALVGLGWVRRRRRS